MDVYFCLLKLEDEVIATVQEGQIIGLDPQNLKGSELYRKLRKIYEDPATDVSEESAGLQKAVPTNAIANASANPIQGEEEAESTGKKKPLLFLCDKQHTFKSINNVIKTAGLAGFPNFQFAVLKK